MDKLIGLFFTVVGLIGVVLFISFVFSWPIMMLWNGCLVSAVDGVHEITWLQAWGISILFNSLFKASVSTNDSK